MSYTVPQDRAAERAVLGAALVGSRQLEDAADMLQGRDFYLPQHELVWDACVAVMRAGRPVDPVAVMGQLGGDLERAGGGVYLAELTSADVSPNPGQLLSYAQAVLDTALRRRLMDAGSRVQQMAHQASDATQAAEDARQLVDEAASQASTASHGVLAGEALAGALDWLEQDQAGVPTPWEDVDRITHGLHDGQMVVIGARPGVGKSVVAKDLAVHTARRGTPVHLATLEMSRNEYMTRIVSGMGQVDLGRMLARRMTDGDWSKVAEVSARVTDLPLFIDDRASQSMAQIRAGARQTRRRMGGLGLVVVDYLQLVQPADRRVPRQEQVAQISRDTKLLAKELHCPVVMLAQLNRGSADRADKRPVITDLRESGSLEQDADQVWLLHRPDLVGDEDHLGELHVIVGKNRNGVTATAELSFQGHYARAVSMV